MGREKKLWQKIVVLCQTRVQRLPAIKLWSQNQHPDHVLLGKGVRCLQTMWLFMAGLSTCLERSVWAAQAVPLDVHLCSTGNIIPSSIGQRKCLHQEVLRMKYLKCNSYRHVQCTNLNYTTSLCYMSLFNRCLHHRMLYGLIQVHSIRFVLFDNWT